MTHLYAPPIDTEMQIDQGNKKFKEIPHQNYTETIKHATTKHNPIKNINCLCN